MKISVIVPVYNTEKYLERCLDSIINQSYKNIEIIIVNDCSTDRSEEIIKNYLGKNENMHYIKNNKNSGAGYARNVGIKRASGDLLSFVDSDDWLSIDYYKHMIECMTRDNTDIVVSGITNQAYDKFPETRYHYQEDNIISSTFALKLLCRTNYNSYYITPIVNNKLYKKELIMNSIAFNDSSYFEDNIFTFILLMQNNRISISSDSMYYYFDRTGSITRSFSFKHIDDFFLAFNFIKSYLIETNEWVNQINNFTSFFKRTISSLFDSLFCACQDHARQRQYIRYLFSKWKEDETIIDLITAYSPERFRTFFLSVL